jgi:hypothetical protein
MDPDAVWKLLCDKLRDLNRNLDDTEASKESSRMPDDPVSLAA